jgi:type III protein arginine methyltransferase
MDEMTEERRIEADEFERLVQAAETDARSLADLASVALSSGNGARAYDLARRARDLAPDDPEIRSRTWQALSAGVPPWHFPMLQDERRNGAFDEALRRAVRPGMRVLDIGAGTGLLAMMAARAGAEFVVTCEKNASIADTARDIVALNGFEGRIRVVAKNSTELDADADMDGRADLVVAEIVSDGLIQESVLPVMTDAVARLLKPGGTAIPSSGSAMVALAHWTALDEMRPGDVSGFDVSPFNRLAYVPYPIEAGDRRLSLCSDAVSLFAFEFASGGPWPGGEAAVELAARAPANGVVQWIRLQLDAETVYENRPAPNAKFCWSPLFTPFDPPREAAAGETVRVNGSYEPTQLRIWLGR